VRRLVYLASIRRDLLAILTYVAEVSGSVEVAQGFVAQLRDRCRALASKPGILGRARPELHPEIRSVAHKGYVIFFRYAGDRLEVVNILEGHRDIDSHFSDSADADS
jgi:toxin ParE1/3/4